VMRFPNLLRCLYGVGPGRQYRAPLGPMLMPVTTFSPASSPKPANSQVRDYPITGHVTDIADPTLVTRTGQFPPG
jgi:hypothetical protein